MTIDGFLKIPDIPGESRREGHEDEIEIHGVTFGLEAHYEAGGSARRGRVSFDMVSVSKYYDRSSPPLKEALVANRRLREVVLSVRRTVEGETSDYLVVTLTDVVVVRYDLAPAPDRADTLAELVGLAYRSISFVYDGQHEVELEVRDIR
ncbi:Hcp family type VI secretion system effector [Ornithinimicrobium cerasi]|uniref:Type VI secretion system secreted protein Hcp n=1 Tax=Ornithinimicrobium cerasi TaxID=2248773 RepID=A0A285VQQ0_9MICO|nr:type VI secretion system tube protein Hcp [Ornithinimicrobium cerasi]SOC56273.1 type VI secretion system secreted protein Hcp [Ornithinimicrobium cerasi]